MTDPSHPEHNYGILDQPAPSRCVTEWYNLEDDVEMVDVTDFRGDVIYLYGFQAVQRFQYPPGAGGGADRRLLAQKQGG